MASHPGRPFYIYTFFSMYFLDMCPRAWRHIPEDRYIYIYIYICYVFSRYRPTGMASHPAKTVIYIYIYIYIYICYVFGRYVLTGMASHPGRALYTVYIYIYIHTHEYAMYLVDMCLRAWRHIPEERYIQCVYIYIYIYIYTHTRICYVFGRYVLTGMASHPGRALYTVCIYIYIYIYIRICYVFGRCVPTGMASHPGRLFYIYIHSCDNLSVLHAVCFKLF